jgi:hypothetical protein
MKKRTPKPLLTICYCCLSMLATAQEKALTSIYPELKKPVVSLQALELTAANTGSEIAIYAICSQSKRGTAEVYITRPYQLKSADNTRLDVAVNKQGFSKNQFAVLYKGNNTQFLDKKAFTRMSVAKSLQLASVPLTPAENSANVLYKLEGLEPGLTYFWRVSRETSTAWEATETLRVEAPTCPVDNYISPK